MVEIPLEQYNSNAALRKHLHSPYLLISPLVEPVQGMKLEKISGTGGDVDPNWRGSPNERITRTLDAFQHYVFFETDEELLISDLEGIIF